MKYRFYYLNPFFILILFVSFYSLASRADISKREAFDILKSQGIKWKMINTISEDADIRVEETSSAFRPKVQLALKQFYAKINPVQYGGDDKTVIDQVGLGSTNLEFNWSLLDPTAKAESRIAIARASASKQTVLQNQTDLTALMLFQYLTVQRLKRQLTVMDANLEKSQLIYKLAKAKNNVGAGIPLDVARAKNLAELDRLKKINAFNKFLKAQHELSTTLGLERLKDTLEPLKATRMNNEALRVLLEKSLQTRPDLKSAELSVHAAKELVDGTNHFIFPKLSLLGEIGTTRATALGFPAQTASGAIGIALTIPIDSGGVITAKKNEAYSLQNKADLQLQQTRLEVLSQVKEAIEQVLSTEEAFGAAEQYVTTVEEESSIAEKRFSQGASNVLDYTSSHANLSTAQDTLTEAMFNLEAAKINYYRTLGSFEGYFENN
ncbi:MAG: TolC family protein [Bdellovibrio sp.]|nr:TolC family protein [Bdellovibrio sp.]